MKLNTPLLKMGEKKNRRRRKKRKRGGFADAPPSVLQGRFQRSGRRLRRVHPSPSVLGVTPSQVDGPGASGNEHKVLLVTFFVPLLLAVGFGSLLHRSRSEKMVGAAEPFVSVRVRPPNR